MSTAMSMSIPRLYPASALPLNPNLSYVAFLPPFRPHETVFREPGHRKLQDSIDHDDFSDKVMQGNRPADSSSSVHEPSHTMSTLPSLQAISSLSTPLTSIQRLQQLSSLDLIDASSGPAFHNISSSTIDTVPSPTTRSETLAQDVDNDHSFGSLSVAEVFQLRPDDLEEADHLFILGTRTLLLIHGAFANEKTRAHAADIFHNLVKSRRAIPQILPEFIAPAPDDDPRASTIVLRSYLIPLIRAYRRNRNFSNTTGHRRPEIPSIRRQSRSIDDPQSITGSFATQTLANAPSASSPSLPLLALENVPSYAEHGVDDLCPARQNVKLLTSTLSKLRPYMYVCGIDAVRNLQSLEEAAVTHVLNVAGNTVPNFFEQLGALTYMKVDLRDGDGDDLNVLLDDMIDFIDRARDQGGTVVVHCHMGISRACTVAAAYLMTREGMSMKAALSEIRYCRPVAEPDSGFMGELEQLQHRIRHGLDVDTLYRVQCHSPRHDPHCFVAVPTATPTAPVLDCNYAWIKVQKARGSIEALCGLHVPAEVWKRAKQIALQKGAETDRYEKMFPFGSSDCNMDHDKSPQPQSARVRLRGPDQWSVSTVSAFLGHLQSFHTE